MDEPQNRPTGPARGVPIGEAARQLGVPIPTLRSWELRYQVPPSERGASEHRRYSPEQLHGMRLMRDEIARGTRAALAAEKVRELLTQTGPAAEFIDGFLAASQRSDPLAVREQLSRGRASLGLAGCLDEVLLPAMRQVGVWWQTGRCDIAQEHLATEASRGWIEELSARAPAPLPRAPIVLACGPHDLHTVGLEGLGILLRYQLWPVRMLGAHTSPTTLTTAIRATGTRGVVVVSHLNSGRQGALRALHEANRLGVQVFYAGNTFTSPRSRRNVPGAYLGLQLREACLSINAALAGATASLAPSDHRLTGLRR